MGLVTVGLDGYWNSQQGFTSSQWKDLSGNGRDGLVVGGASRSASGLTFNGVDSRIRLALPAIYDSSTQPYTVDFWVQFDGDAANWSEPTLFSTDDSDSQPTEFYYVSDADEGYFRHIAYPDGSRISIPLFIARELTHLAITFDGSTYRVYRNGILVQTYTFMILPLHKPGGNFIIGGTERRGTFYYPWKGIIDCFRVYNRELAASEIVENFNLGMAVGMTSTTGDLNGTIQAKSRAAAVFENTDGIGAQAGSSLTSTADLSVEMTFEASASASLAAEARLNGANIAAAATSESGASADLDVAPGPGVTPVELAASAGGSLTGSGYFYLAIVAATNGALAVTGFVNTDRPLVALAGGKVVTSAHLSLLNPFSAAVSASGRASGTLKDSVWKKVDVDRVRWKTV